MPGDYKAFLDDILEAAERIIAYSSSRTSPDFTQDKMTMDAILRNFLVIGEAAKYIPAHIRNKHPDVAWQKLISLRNVLMHEYFGIKASVVRSVVEERLPVLKDQVRLM